MKSVLLKLKIWCSCFTQRKRACTALLKMIGVHLTCLLYVLAQKKKGFVKFCEAHEQRLRLNVHDFRVIRADAAEGDTYINVGGFLAEWTTGKKICGQ